MAAPTIATHHCPFCYHRYYEVVHLGNRLRNHLRCWHLNLSLCNLGVRAGRWLCPAIGSIQGLQDLDLSYNGIDDEIAMMLMEAVCELNHIRSILLCWNDITSRTILGLEKFLPKFKKLQRLYFNGNPLKENGVMQFLHLLQSNTKVEDINIGFCKATFPDAGCIADMMRNNKTVVSINCDGIAMGDEGATNIADALLVRSHNVYGFEYMQRRE